jgi:death-on-curing protein
MTRFVQLPLALVQVKFLGFHVRDMGLLQGCLARPQTNVYGQDAYPSITTKGAALLHSIVTTHPMIDGNKGTGWTLLITFLQLNELEIIAAPDDALDFIVGVGTGEASLDGIATWIEERLVPAGAN